MGMSWTRWISHFVKDADTKCKKQCTSTSKFKENKNLNQESFKNEILKSVVKNENLKSFEEYKNFNEKKFYFFDNYKNEIDFYYNNKDNKETICRLYAYLPLSIYDNGRSPFLLPTGTDRKMQTKHIADHLFYNTYPHPTLGRNKTTLCS